MNVGRAQIDVVVVMVIVVMAVIGIAGMMVFAQQPGARKIDGEAECRNRNSLLEMNHDRIRQAQDRLVPDPKRDHAKHDGAGECRQIAEFSGPERKARVLRMAPGEQVGKAGNRQGRNVGAHMPAVGDQRHRTENGPAGDLGHHHHRGKNHHDPGAALVPVVMPAEE